MIPFIVLTTIRSGSTNLTRLLNDHPDVVCNGEVFNAEDPDYSWAADPPRTTEEMIQRTFVAFPGQHEGVKAVGCKVDDVSLLAEQARLVRLMNVPDIRFIILQRRNQFECLRSLMQASATDIWQLNAGEVVPLPPVTLSPLAARTFFERAETFYGRISLLIPPGQRVWVDYDQFRAQPDYVLGHLYTFLGVDPHTPTAELQKMEERPLSETVSNYGELQLLFAGTDYSIFLP